MIAVVALLNLLCGSASAADVEPSVRLLSRYAPGQVPVEGEVLSAIGAIGQDGASSEVPVLRSLIERERPEVRDAALLALDELRSRGRQERRESFAASLPEFGALDAAAQPFRTRGLGDEEALCAAYAALVLGDGPAVKATPAAGDGWELLRDGRPRSALAASLTVPGADGLRLQAAARDELGDVRGAVAVWAELAAAGDQPARDELDAYGIDAERLLLGMLAGDTEAPALEVLVRSGGDLTVEVLAERTRSPRASEAVTATDALARMLDPRQRDLELPPPSAREARRALSHASTHGPLSVREIALEALSGP